MPLKKASIASKAYTSTGTFRGEDFGSSGQMTAWKIINVGTKDCYIFGTQPPNCVTIAAGTQSDWYRVPEGYQDTTTHSFTFDANGNNAGIIVVAAIATE